MRKVGYRFLIVWCMSFATSVGLASHCVGETLYDTIVSPNPSGFVIGASTSNFFSDFESGFLLKIEGPLGTHYRIDDYRTSLQKVLPVTVAAIPVPVEFNLFENTGGLPGTLIDTFTIGVSDPTTYGSEYTSQSTLRPVVRAGKGYWLTARVNGTFEGVSWLFSGPFNYLEQTTISRDGNGPWNVDLNATVSVPGLRITGTVASVPEATSASLVAFACFIAACVSRKRR